MIDQKHLKLTRMSGAGNTFFLVTSEQGTTEERALFARQICNDFVGFSTDGVLFLQNSTEADAKWDFYNSDGSHAEMCGNVARCAGLFYFAKVKSKRKIIFSTAAGKVTAEIVDPNKGIVRIRMPEIRTDFGPKETVVNKRKIRGFYVNTGVPHFVIQQEPDEALARQLRQSTDFGERGANITFVEFDSSDFIQAVTFERGVEDFTLACGTGAVAAAKFHHEGHPAIKTQTIEMPGGLLQVDWMDGFAYLTGPAEFHFDIQLYEDLVL